MAGLNVLWNPNGFASVDEAVCHALDTGAATLLLGESEYRLACLMRPDATMSITVREHRRPQTLPSGRKHMVAVHERPVAEGVADALDPVTCDLGLLMEMRFAFQKLAVWEVLNEAQAKLTANAGTLSPDQSAGAAASALALGPPSQGA